MDGGHGEEGLRDGIDFVSQLMLFLLNLVDSRHLILFLTVS